jgi:hypothetical protein
MGEFNHVPKEHMTLENFKEKDSLGMSLMHSAVNYGTLSKLPKEFLVEEAILSELEGENNILHLACETSTLKCVPVELLTEKALLQKDNEGNSVFHYAANYGELDKIPEHLLSEKIILTENYYGKDVVDFCIHGEVREGNLEFDQSPIILRKLKDSTIKKIFKSGRVKDKKMELSFKKEISRRALMITMDEKPEIPLEI